MSEAAEARISESQIQVDPENGPSPRVTRIAPDQPSKRRKRRRRLIKHEAALSDKYESLDYELIENRLYKEKEASTKKVLPNTV